MATITPASTLHAAIDVAQNNIDTADAAWMALHTWQQLADNAKYALDQIAVQIAALKADNALTFTGTTVTVDHDLEVSGDLAVTGNVALTGTLSGTSGGRVVPTVRTISTWGGDPPTVVHAVTSGTVVRAIASVAVVLRLLPDGAVVNDCIRVCLADGASVAVHNNEDVADLATISVEGASLFFTFSGTAWELG